MSDAMQAVRLLREMERLEHSEPAEVTQTSGLEALETSEIPDGPDDRGVIESSSAAKPMSMTALLESLVTRDFDLGQAIVDSAHDA